jgi:GTP-binding protein EngB required for normal cell division
MINIFNAVGLSYQLVLTKIDELKDVQLKKTLEEIVEKSKKFAYQNISEFCNDIKQAVEKNDIDLESIQALLARRKKNSSHAMQIDKEIYTTLLPVYFELRNKGYNHTDLCN